tara:strand:+ start:567 stop:935 length:369 start_codon:yes stop_codon:yes gene_type:complete
MTFEYNPIWTDDPIVYSDGTVNMYDPSEVVPVQPDHPDYGKTGQEVDGKTKCPDSLVAEYKEKNTWAQMRRYRNNLLVKSDWTQGADVPSGIKTPWATYRQSLRDITTAATTSEVVWPTTPS